jgi:hypothetical protein
MGHGVAKGTQNINTTKKWKIYIKFFIIGGEFPPRLLASQLVVHFPTAQRKLAG